MGPVIRLPDIKIDRSLGPWPYALALAVLALSVAAAVYLARWHSLHELEERGVAVAEEILGRSHAITAQIDLTMRTLEHRADPQPCSDANVQLMRRLAVGASYLQAVGYVRDNRLLCSSYGLHGAGIPLGPPDYLSRVGYYIRGAVQLPFAGERVFLTSTHRASGYTVVILPDVPIDLLHHEPEVALGLVNLHSGKFILQRGPVHPAWFSGIAPASGVRRAVVDDTLLVVHPSSTFDFAAFVAIPLSARNRDWLGYGWMLTLPALVAGVALATLIIVLARRRMALPRLLRQALRRRELFLVYQPIVELATGRWVGAEALVRWRRPDGTLIGPDVFIPLAERSDLICQVTAQVIEMATRESAALLKTCPAFHISINFSSRDLADPRVAASLREAIGRCGILPGNLTVEVTERVLVEMEEVSRNVRALRASGIRIAIDDFGTGYCGLSYLTTLELDFLKIDKLFVDTIGTDAATSQVVAHIIEIAKSLALEMIAEGVETREQAEYLQQHGVQCAQGWFYSRPISMQDLAARLAQASPRTP